MKLNLGCGKNFKPGWVNVDKCIDVQSDVWFDLDCLPWPFDDNSADQVEMYAVLEHLSDTMQTLAELHRVMKPGATCHIHVPYAGSHWAFQDPTHKRYFTERTMNYVMDEFAYNFYGNVRFEILRAKLTVGWNSPTAIIRNLIPFRKILRWFLWNMYDGVDYIIRKP